jgi:hypothetical protein
MSKRYLVKTFDNLDIVFKEIEGGKKYPNTLSSKLDVALKNGGIPLVADNKKIIKELDKSLYDITVDTPNKFAIMFKAKEYIENRSSNADVVDYLDYIDINNELASRGFFITDSNKEEKYLEILETGDDILIDLLEEFLAIKDKISVFKNARKVFTKVHDNLIETDENDVERLKEIEAILE